MHVLTRTAYASALVLVTAATSACTSLPVSQVYLSEPTYGVYLAFPQGWAVLEASKEQGGDYVQPFGMGEVDTAYLFQGDTPSGYVTVRLVPGSLESALKQAENSAIVDLQQALKTGAAEIVIGPTEEADTGSIGREWTINANVGEGQASTIRQRVLVGTNPVGKSGTEDTYLVKALVVGCSQTCFTQYRSSISSVFNSWKVT